MGSKHRGTGWLSASAATIPRLAKRTSGHGMRRYWDDRARENAVWYVDTSTDYAEPDLERFFADGRAIVDVALTNAPAKPDGRALAVEIGPGLGRVCSALADHFDAVVGVDVSPEMVERARQMVPDERITFEVGDGSSLFPVADSSADLVMSFTVFQHLPTPELVDGYIADAARVLRPGGVLAFQWNNEPNPGRWRRRRRWLVLQRRLRLPGGSDERFAPQFLGTRVPIDRVLAAIAVGGLELEATKGEGTLYAWAWARRPRIT